MVHMVHTVKAKVLGSNLIVAPYSKTHLLDLVRLQVLL